MDGGLKAACLVWKCGASFSVVFLDFFFFVWGNRGMVSFDGAE